MTPNPNHTPFQELAVMLTTCLDWLENIKANGRGSGASRTEIFLDSMPNNVPGTAAMRARLFELADQYNATPDLKGDALRVLLLDPRTAAVLKARDPMAYYQGLRALGITSDEMLASALDPVERTNAATARMTERADREDRRLT